MSLVIMVMSLSLPQTKRNDDHDDSTAPGMKALPSAAPVVSVCLVQANTLPLYVQYTCSTVIFVVTIASVYVCDTF